VFLLTVVNIEVLNTSAIYGDFVETSVSDHFIVKLPLTARYGRGKYCKLTVFLTH